MIPLRRNLRCLMLLSLLAAACAGGGAAGPLTETVYIRLPMGYIPDIQFSPFYVADARGYFREAGIEIEFDYSFETDGVALVGADELQFALASGEQVLLARAEDLPVVYVMAWFQEYPIAVAARGDLSVDDPADLRGLKVGIPGLFGATYVGYRALLSAAGLPDDVATLETIGFNQVAALAEGQVDAAVVYANNEPIQLEAQGVPVHVIEVADYVSLASNGLVTNEITIRENPDLVRRMVRAILRGLEDVIEDPEAAAYEISKDYVEGLEEADKEVQMRVLRASIEMWKADRLGYADPEAWRNMHDVLLEMGLLAEPIDWQAAFTNEFLPGP